MNENETKKLSRTDLFSMAIGQIIGVGIMTMTGIAIGFLETNLMVILIMIVCLTIAVVIMGTYTGYHFGFEHKRKAYVGGAILLWIAGFDVVFRYAMM